MDADGQHLPEDMLKLLEAAQDKAISRSWESVP